MTFTDSELKTLYAVLDFLRYSENRDVYYNMGSRTVKEANQIYYKLEDWYKGEVLGWKYDDEYGWYNPNDEYDYDDWE